jgi:tRNA-specific 2-thiouridylase
MSGGVDSSVAAALLVEQGYDCVGVFMRQGRPEEAEGGLPIVEPARAGHQGCCSVADAVDARRVADRLGIPLYPLDLTADFGRIIDYFANEYGRGRTPNPCVRCNSWLKFGRLFDHAEAIGATHVATGHYARLASDASGTPRLLRGLERARDQSYVLFEVPRDRLARMLLPVGGLPKADVRARAATLGLATADKPDSQEICFVAPGRHAALVGRRLGGSRAGEIVDPRGRVLGRHPGIEHFTVGQREGLGIATGERLYVIRIEADTCRVIVGPRDAVPEQELVAAEATWIGPPPTAAFPPRPATRRWGAASPTATSRPTPMATARTRSTAAAPTATTPMPAARPRTPRPRRRSPCRRARRSR